MSTLQAVELGVLGPLQVRRDGAPVMIPGAKPRAILTMLGLHGGSVVSAETLIELLWGDDPPRTAAKALQTHISLLRRTLGDGFVLTAGTGWTLAESGVDAARYKSAARLGRDAAAAGDTSQAVSRFEEALALWRGIPELPDGRRGTSEKTRWIEGHAALVEDRADALLVTGRAAEIVGELEAAVADAPLRERRWGQLMLALYRAGRQGDALGAYQRARALLADELGVDPGPDLRRLEAAIVGQDTALEIPAAQDLPSVTRTVTFLLTDIEGSTAAWEADADAMAVALARHDELVEQVVTSRGGRLIKTRGEGDATFSVFERASAAAAAAIELQDAIFHEPWNLQDPMRIRVALHTGEVELRDGDYFGRAVNRAARLRSLAIGGQILCSGAIAELVVDSLPDDVVLADLGMRQLRNLARPEHVFELRLETAAPPQKPNDAPIERPDLPAVLTGPGPFVGRGRELEGLVSGWQTALAGGTHAVLIAGEPGVGKTRLAGEWSRQAYQLEAIVLYGRCDEDLGAPYQPFAEALRSLVPCLGTSRLRGMRGVEALLPLVPGLTDVLPDLAAPTRADPETERYALFDAVVALLELASADAPVVLILDDLHWAAKPTLLLLRHLLRFGDRARVQIVGTYRSTDLDRSHPLAAMLADLHRGAGSGTANRLALSGLGEDDVTAYVTEAGYHDEELARALASVTGGNPFFLIEALRHVDETGGVWDPTTLPQGVRETVSRRLSRLTAETNTALAAAAVVGSRFALDLVEKVVEQDLVDAFDEASKAGIVIEEPGGRYRFNHAIVRQSLLAELPSVRRLRLHQRIATTLETQPGADDELLAELAHHYFECAWAGNAAKAVEYCRRAADQAVARLAYEGAADLYGQALHALDEIDDELPDRDDQAGELLVARCEALLAAGDVASAAGAVSKLQEATINSPRLAAWATCFDGQLSMLIHPERLDEVENALRMAAQKLAELDDAAGEANAHTVRAACLARLGRIGDGEIALDDALTAARRARDHRRVNAVLAGAPLAALWGPNPVPRAGGRCLDVVRLLRITTDSPAVEATSTRCQAVLEAFRGRAEAARRMIDSARRTVTELGLRHARLEVEQFAGIVELIADDPTAAEPHFRQAYNGFRRMGLDADAAETAALLGRTCLALDRGTEADELCLESERLAGHALKASIHWRTLRARLLSHGHQHGEARRIAEAAVALAERTDALVDHGDACASLATVLDAGGDVAGARAAAERAVDLYERKGAAALAEKVRRVLGEPKLPSVPVPPEPPPVVELDNACTRAGKRLAVAINRGAWDEFEQLYAPEVFSESRRKAIGFTHAAGAIVPPENWAHEIGRVLGASGVHLTAHDIAIRGERLALARLAVGTADASPGAPQDEFLQIYGIDEQGRISLQIFFDLEDTEAAIGELDAAHARFDDEARSRAPRLENAASQAAERYMAHFAARDWDALATVLADDICVDDRRRGVNAGIKHGRDAEIANLRAAAGVGISYFTYVVIAARGERLTLARFSGETGEYLNEVLGVTEINSDNQIAAIVVFELDDVDSAIAELDARYLAGEAAAHARTWSVIAGAYAGLNRREFPATTPDWVNIDHRGETAFGAADLKAYLRGGLEEPDQDINVYIEAVHRLSDPGAVLTYAAYETSREGFDAEWRGVAMMTVEGEMISRSEVFDEADLHTALAKFDQLSRPAPRLDNLASQSANRYMAHFASRDWDELAKVLADDVLVDDRRRVVNAGIKHGRDAEIANLRAFVDVGITYFASVVMAARGQRLILARFSAGEGGGSGEFFDEVLGVVEINSHSQISAIVFFELDDFDAAFEELDARYLAGEAAPHAHTWSVIVGASWSLFRHELPPTTPDWVNLDHRRGIAFAPSELTAHIRAAWDVEQDLSTHIEAVYRLNNRGAVFVQVLKGTSQEGFDAEWRIVELMAVEGDLISRGEIFDEADIDAALARFDQLSRPASRLENAASQTVDRYLAHFAARDWDELAEVLADDIFVDDRRRAVNAGIRHGRDAEIANLRAALDVGITYFTSIDIAARGERLIVARVTGGEGGPAEFLNDVLGTVEINSHNQIAAIVVFDPEDFEAAIAELDARYLAGEAAANAHVLQPVMDTVGELNRHKPGPMLGRLAFADHRRVPFGSAENYGRAIEELWTLVPDARYWTKAVHALDGHGLVSTLVIEGTDAHGNELQWGRTFLFLSNGPRVEVYEEDGVDAALARFEELRPPVRRLENAASKLSERHSAHFGARDWEALAKVLADDFVTDDRRRAVNAGIRRGRDAEIANMQAAAEVGITYTAFVVIAVRGERLILTHASVGGGGSADFTADVLSVIEINSHNEIAAFVIFELDDFEAATAELDARYLAGEAAAHAHTWSVVAGTFASVSRQELPALTPDCATMDHRRVTAFAPGEMTAYIRAGWEIDQTIRTYVEAVHRLSDLGAVCTYAAHGVSREGFNGEWRGVNLATVDGDMVDRSELFDETDLDAALARFDELGRPAPWLENAASRVAERALSYFATRDWDAVSQVLADDFVTDDRRRIINAGIRYGRDAEIENWRAAADVGFTNLTSTVVATRGGRLILAHLEASGRDPEAIRGEFLVVIEIDADERIVAFVVFELDDFEAALAELDARYLAGEAAAQADTWSILMRAYAALNRHELPSTTTDWVNIDHRRGTSFASGEMPALLDAAWTLTTELRNYVEAVHRLSDLGVVVTNATRETSQDGFDAEWRVITIGTVEGDMLNRCEVFDEGDLDAALAKFEQLSRSAPRLENAASQVTERFLVRFAAREWDAMPQILSDNFSYDDRRRVVGSGVRLGGVDHVKDMRASAELWTANVTPTVMATRGERLVLAHLRFPGRDQGPEAFVSHVLGIVEINASGRMVTFVSFDLDDFDTAIAELDARYIAGEAAAQANTWSVIAGGYAALNRHELPATTPDGVNMDHRRGGAFAPGELSAYIRAAWENTPNAKIYVELVHRLSSLGAVVTQRAHGVSLEGFDAEWRDIAVMTVDGGLISRGEIFDEADLAAALAKFDDLSRQAPRLENSATRAWERLFSCIAAGDWDAVAQATAENVCVDDRRRVVNAGILHGRDANIKDAQATVAVGFAMTIGGVLATRGERFSLIRVHVSGHDPEAIRNDALAIVAIDADDRISASVVFDLEDFEAAIAELDARYIAGEAAALAGTWSVIAGVFVAHNRREIAAVTTDAVSLDHRRGAAFAPGEGFEYIRAGWDLGQNLNIYIEIAHRLNDLGAVFTWAGQGTSQEGFDAEWRGVTLMTVDREIVSRMEVFDEADLDAALAKFDQLSRPTPRLENTASQMVEQFLAHFAVRNWDAMEELLTVSFSSDDRRRVINAGIRRGRDVEMANWRTTADIWTTSAKSTVVATRGERLVLFRIDFLSAGPPSDAFHAAALTVVEVDDDNRGAANVVFDIDDIDAAFAELDARYLAGEAAPYRDAWSVIAAGYAALNRYEVPPSAPDYVNIDHRLRATFEAGDLGENLRAAWELTPTLKGYVEVVHRLSGRGAVVTHAAHGATQDGLDAEWRGIHFLTLEGGMVNRCEIFDEADLDAALVRFEEMDPHTRRLQNAASRVHERFLAYFAAGDWDAIDAIAEMMAEDFSHDDRRPVVGAGVQHGRDAYIVDMRAVAELWNTNLESTVVAIRGERLVLLRNRLSVRDEEPEAFSTEVLAIGEIDADERGVAVVTFDVDDIDAAFAELDARYLAGEGAAHAHAWSVIAGTYSAFNRGEPPGADWVSVDHRRATPFTSKDLTESIRTSLDFISNLRIQNEAVHRLSDFGAVVTSIAYGTSQQGFDAEWRTIQLLTIEDNRINRCELFDEEDLDTALARFEELHAQPQRLQNAASRVTERCRAALAVRDWDAMAEILAYGFSSEDRRRVVNSGIRQGRDLGVKDMQAAVDVIGITYRSFVVIATRGEQLELISARVSNDKRPETAQFEVLQVSEIDTDGRVAAVVTMDIDDIDAAFEELETRYLAGEGAAHAHAWSVIANATAAFNRHEMPSVTPHWVNIDHRRVTAFVPGELAEYIGATWDVAPVIRNRIVAVHRLTDLGAVITQASHGTSQEGFEAEWREITLLTVEGDSLNHVEIFDEADLDAALARFEELQPQAPRLQNAASRMDEQLRTHLAARDWAAMADLLTEDTCTDDRRRIVNVGIRRGRDVTIAYSQAMADLGVKIVTSDVVSIRGARLFLSRTRWLGPDKGPEDFHTEVLNVVEIDLEQRIAARVMFDADDIDAAHEELDARYLAGEAAASARTWSVIAAAHAGFNRQELPATTPDPVYIDHRPLVSIEGGDLAASLRAVWDITPVSSVHVEAVHRLDELGAVFSQVLKGTSPEGLDAEWRMLHIFTVEGDLCSRVEVFGDADLDAALARFEELHPQTPRLENAASRLHERFLEYYAAEDSQAMAEMLADNYSSDDRRRVVGSGVRDGRDAHIADMRVRAELWNTNLESTVTAIRGERLALMRIGLSDRAEEPEAFSTEVLAIGEIDSDERLVASVTFDLDEIDAAFADLDARYLAGEAAAHAQTWSVIAGIYAGFNRREPPATTQDSVFTDHRPLQNLGAVDLVAAIRSMWDVASDLNVCIEAVHRLGELGAVVTQTLKGTSQEGLDAEWRTIEIFMVEGDLLSRCEAFDEADLDAALARFEELQPQTQRLENAASRMIERFQEYFAARNWAAVADNSAEEIFTDDRRSVVGSGILHGRGIDVANIRAIADLGATRLTSAAIATRGERLVLTRLHLSGRDQRPEAFHSEMLGIVEIDEDNRVAARFLFDLNDIDAAFEELDARYLAGEAAAHARIWSVVAEGYARLNKHELPPWASDWLTIDHRMRETFEAADQTAYIRGAWDITPDLKMYIEVVHRLSNFGAVLTHAAYGSTPDGFDAEWRMIELIVAGDDTINRCELFDEADLDVALARFEELQPPAWRLENAASQVAERFWAYFESREWDAMAEIIADDCCTHDRRRVVNADVLRGRAAHVTNMRAVAEVGFAGLTSTVLATREHRLVLMRIHSSARGSAPGEVTAEMLSVVEIDTDNRLAGAVIFDSDDIDAAFEELEARYLADEAAAYAQTWSVIARTYAAFNRHEFPSTTQNSVYIDHRPLVTNDATDLTANIRAIWDLMDVSTYIAESVHRLSERGAVVTQALKGTSKDGLDIESRMIDVFTVENDLVTRVEVFDEADLDAALARFEELHPHTPRLENAASRVYERFWTYFAARDWAAMADMLAVAIHQDDRRRVVNAGMRKGRDAFITDMRAVADVGTDNLTSTVIATRGNLLALSRVRSTAFQTEVLNVVEIDTDEQLARVIAFDLDDIAAAFEELEARYLAGEAAAHAQTWSVIARINAAFNRRELPKADWVTIDHRPLPLIEADSQAALQVWEVTPDFDIRSEKVHRLGGFGAVATYQANGASPEGFGGEWRIILLLTVEGDRIDRCEVFDESDLDTALARFDELPPQVPRLENAASQIIEQYQACFAARDWTAMAEVLADDIVADDRRRVVNAGVRRGRDVQIADVRAAVDVGAETISSRVIATRGKRLALAHVHSVNRFAPGEVGAEMLGIAEIDADERLVGMVSFDLDDIDAAFEELDARYLAGEAAAHSDAWSVITHTYAAFNRHELAAADWVTIDHRPLVAISPNDLPATIRAVWDLTPDVSIHIEAVHRLSIFGAVVTDTMHGTSPEGFDAEWRMIQLLTVEGDRIKRCEVFDEADLDAALAKFDELDRRTPRLENAAGRLVERYFACFSARDWATFAELLADDIVADDRRHVVNAGVRHGRDLHIADMRATVEVSAPTLSSTVIATRGERLALAHVLTFNLGMTGEVGAESLGIGEIDADERIIAAVIFDPDNIDAAFEELDARYLAGEAAAHAQTWSVIANATAAFNRHELPAADWVIIDHRPLAPIDASDLPAAIRAIWDVTPDLSTRIEAVHRLSSFGAVVTNTAYGTSPEGFAAEWRVVDLVTVDGDRISRDEFFDEADLDAALSRFDELDRETPRLENAATRTWARVADAFNRRDAADLLALASTEGRYEDRRKGLRNVLVGAARRKAVQALFETMPSSWRLELEFIAIRGSRLSLTRERYRDIDEVNQPITSEILRVMEVDDRGLMQDAVSFDPDDLDDAVAELTARWIASGEVAYPELIEAVDRINATINRHDWDAAATYFVGAEYVNHRQLGHAVDGPIDDLRVELSEILARCAIGIVGRMALKGTSTDGAAIEIPFIVIILLRGERVTRLEAFEEDKRDVAVARLQELNQPV